MAVKAVRYGENHRILLDFYSAILECGIRERISPKTVPGGKLAAQRL
jgi:hypothetical protein